MRSGTSFFSESAPIVCLIFCLAGGSARAQSREAAGPISGQVVRIDPADPKGGLKVIQAKGLDPINANVSMLVRKGNLLIREPSARASVRCGDGKEHKLEPGLQPCPCTEPCTPEVCGINYAGSRLRPTRGPDTNLGLFPVVISPRKTDLLNPRPTIRWAPIAGTKDGVKYKVTILGENMKVVWTRDVDSKTWLPYPDNEPPLPPGQTYKVVVAAEFHSSDEDRSPDLGFITLTSDQARAVANEETKIKDLGLPGAQTRFLVANLYSARRLYAEAIEQLEDLDKTAKDAAVARTLGDLYGAIGLSREAERNYLEALGLQDAADLEGVGLIQKSLAETYENLGIFDQAIARFEEAIKAYERLHNEAMINALSGEQRRLK
jgi:hypothetical protein